jgi:hypothetical protein
LIIVKVGLCTVFERDVPLPFEVELAVGGEKWVVAANGENGVPLAVVLNLDTVAGGGIPRDFEATVGK